MLKAAKPNPSNEIQVMLYMSWLPLVNPKLQQVNLSEEVYYGEEAGITIPASRPEIQGNNGKPQRQSNVQDGRQEGAQRQRVPLLSHQQPVLS